MRFLHGTQPHRRSGLTLVELLVVILIIGILMALLIPAVGGAFRAAKQAQVNAEISNMATALASFQTKYGEFPPSRFYCAENGDYSIPTADASDATKADLNQLKQRSAKYMQRFWPRVAIKTNPSAANPKIAIQGFYDFNGNGRNDSDTDGIGSYILQGPECLVFFLGGITRGEPSTTAPYSTLPFAMVGFAKDPSNPFRTEVSSGTVNRTPPLYEFNASRLDDSEVGTKNGVPSYLDTMGSAASLQDMTDSTDKRPFAYFASYGNNGYDPNDYNAQYEKDDNSGAAIARKFYVNFSATLVESIGPNPYTVSAPIGGTSAAMTSATFQNPQSYQIIASGFDRKWGIGGAFTPSANTRVPFQTSNFYDSGTNVLPAPSGNPRAVERDNLANFAGGRLE